MLAGAIAGFCQVRSHVRNSNVDFQQNGNPKEAGFDQAIYSYILYAIFYFYFIFLPMVSPQSRTDLQGPC